MKQYPSIPHVRTGQGNEVWYGFDKLDGSLIRAEWTSKNGFTKFGRRGGLLDDSNPFLRESETLILENQDKIIGFLVSNKIKHAVLFYEFYGEHSFAGTHIVEPHKITLVDAAFGKKGLVDPGILVQLADRALVDSSGLLYRGPITGELLEDIDAGRLPGITFEGVVFKRNMPRGNVRKMWKKKTKAWFEELRQVYANDKSMVEKLY